MSKHTEKSPQVKTCCRGDDCVHPDGPTLPLTEFYKRRGSKDGRESLCKPCRLKYGRDNQHLNTLACHREHPMNPNEALVIDRLRSFGIFASPGKSSIYRWIDVVAWGCVRIEVKASTLHKNGMYQFGIGRGKHGKEKDRSDLVVLVALGDEPSFHVFPSDHPVFYHPNGSPKSAVSYATRGNPPKSGRGVVLNSELMAQAKDRWELVGQRALEISNELRETGVVQLTKETERVQLNLFGLTEDN